MQKVYVFGKKMIENGASSSSTHIVHNSISKLFEYGE